MMLKRNSSPSQRSAWSLLRAGLAGLTLMVGGAAVTGGCLDRPVAPAVPRTSNVYVDEIRQTAVDKIDLLFMIDNSISMADKQAILADAVPLLVRRLITPICVTPCTEATCTEQQQRDGIPVPGADASNNCAGGGAPEFSPIKDIHVGVVTSSLGSHGAAGANDVCTKTTDDDHAHLLGELRNTRDGAMLKPYDGNGFLKWDTTATEMSPSKYNPPGDSNADTFIGKFTDMVKASGEGGCGYEASLEAWYRFLIDPEPPAKVEVSANSLSQVTAVDNTVITQRQAFLRPDSLVAVIMLSDENDCSIVDEGYGWLIARTAVAGKVPQMYRSTSQCLNNPNDNCCQSCGESAAHDGCPAIASDSECAKGKTLADVDDSPNLRCWQQKRRFGFELLYPTRRYSAGLRDKLVPQRSTGMMVQNPLYAAAEGKAPRDSGLVFLAGIVGVPWQDIADKDSLTSADSLRYLTEAQMESEGRWDVILGNPNADTNAAPVLPSDGLMIETPEDRTMVPGRTNPITGDALVPSDSTNPRANPINGHEQKNIKSSDLQYACIFPLATPVDCTADVAAAGKGCDCFTEELEFNRPLCQPAGGGAATTKQNFAKAYPGTRHLQVLKEYKDNSIVASICPKVVDGKDTKPDYGYNPAVKAIIDRLKEALKGKCLPRPLVPNDTMEPKDGLEPGQVPCAVIEAVPPTGGACACNAAGRAGLETRPQLRDAVLNKLKASQTCSDDAAAGQTKCSDYCTCELKQLAGDDLKACQNNTGDVNIPGYCYINAAPNEPNVGNEQLVKDCSPDSKRLLRFVGGTPAQGAIALVACLGASLGSQ